MPPVDERFTYLGDEGVAVNVADSIPNRPVPSLDVRPVACMVLPSGMRITAIVKLTHTAICGVAAVCCCCPI